jgi:hypothetical protein
MSESEDSSTMDKSICEIDYKGNKLWYLGNKLHREDGPAREDIDGDKYWWLNGKLHREDGPAVQYEDGRASYWFINNIELKPEIAINDLELQAKYPRLVEAMIIYLVHNS